MAQDRHHHQLSRRGFLGAGAGALAVTTLGAPSAPAAASGRTSAAATAAGDASVSLAVDPAAKSSWAVARTAFGQFMEINERKPYPGMVDQHLTNGSFEQWWLKGNREPWYKRTDVIYEDTPYLPEQVAYPWEPVPAGATDDPGGGVAFEMAEGGVHGRRPPDIVEGVQTFQRVRVQDTTGGVRQRVALPDERTPTYDLSVWVRGEGVGSLAVRMLDSAGDVVAETALELTAEWRHHEVRMRFSHASPTKYVNHFHGRNIRTPWGEYVLAFTVTGAGHVDLDFATLMAGDAVRGKFNPTTLQRFRDFGVGSLRWPGGTYTSVYHWEYGIGPWKDRPVTTNQVWGGLDYYYFGLDEYLEFCELANVEPYVNLGFNTPSGRGDDVTPEEAARCVEYCNGDISTKMGALRAANGRAQPWNVKQWQIGNETWGPRQYGHTDAATHAEEFKAYYDKMKAVDPSISVFAVGCDVWQTRLGEPPGTPPEWNKDFMDVAGDKHTDGLDIHNYVIGTNWRADRPAFMDEHDLDPVEYNQTLIGYPTGVDRCLDILRGEARDRGIKDLKITYGEFNTHSLGDADWPVVHWETVANSAFVAGMYNTFIRQGDMVRYSHIVDNTIFYRAHASDHWPVSPAHRIRQLYTDPFRMQGLSWHQADVDISGPTFDIFGTERMMPTPDVPVVDAACLVSDDGQIGYVFAVNRDLKQRHQVRLSVAGWPPGDAMDKRSGPRVTARMLSSVPEDDPFVQERDFNELTASRIRDFTLTPDADGAVSVELPPAATIRVRFDAVNP